ncbi:hypothetical protein K502DRAFT_323694 [Neoconidiobolus thromboides FSU 785]|nr:hypothetical protein K502DRAFT_323694 [Neoconidiobolus thromboides FSU 785]
MLIEHDVLPEYEALEQGTLLPRYTNRNKVFTIRNEYSLTPLHKTRWKIQEGSGKVTWYKVEKYQRGLQLIEYNKQILLETKRFSNQAQNFQIGLPSWEFPLAQVNACCSTCFQLLINRLGFKGSFQDVYVIKKRKVRNSELLEYRVYMESSESSMIASFRLSCVNNTIAYMKFSSNLQLYEFHIILTCFVQLVSFIYS